MSSLAASEYTCLLHSLQMPFKKDVTHKFIQVNSEVAYCFGIHIVTQINAGGFFGGGVYSGLVYQ